MSGKNEKEFDEQTLAKVLEAAYVLQEHNRELREGEERKPPKVIATAASASGSIGARGVEPAPAVPTVRVTTPVKPESSSSESKSSARPDYTVVLAQIVETQQKIQAERLELEYAMLEIAERATQIAQADGAGIGLLDSGKVRYRAAAGAMALPMDTEVAMEKALSTACLRIGQVIRCTDVNTEFLVDMEECRRRGIEAMIAAPIHHSGTVVGALELYYGNREGFTEPDVHTCQLMAGLVAESLARSEERNWKKSVETERATMRDALEKLKPSLEALAQPAPAKESILGHTNLPQSAAPANARCRKCGHDLVKDEQFCGECGWPCGSDYQAGGSTQSKVASLWKNHPIEQVSPANGNGAALSDSFASDDAAADFLRRELPELFSHPESVQGDANLPKESAELGLVASDHSAEPSSTPGPEESHVNGDIILPAGSADWSSAASARQFLEQVVKTDRPSSLGRFLRARRGDIYLAIAVILISCVIRWGIWSPTPGNTTSNPALAAHRKPGADLPLYDRVLINLGLAEAPPPPEYKGNPNAQVWVDVQTALYYCPGADLYGKTLKGRLTTQRDAQLDQYEPALRRPCE